ncbi:hypothetical protein EYF80_051363 [Liparis tanakae]|uniref:Uncharacterized protein n=1 Tax=Liparis tanakae TaxID=230148 RepID=A0A4Z2FC11_9TELE|nr:hypothetical protein EYF80_051363 [Liparis tanakae]
MPESFYDSNQGYCLCKRPAPLRTTEALCGAGRGGRGNGPGQRAGASAQGPWGWSRNVYRRESHGRAVERSVATSERSDQSSTEVSGGATPPLPHGNPQKQEAENSRKDPFFSQIPACNRAPSEQAIESEGRKAAANFELDSEGLVVSRRVRPFHVSNQEVQLKSLRPLGSALRAERATSER